ncbi:hypothetical protein KPH14_012252 [Odynerus spinipes]|uniref:PiggyBac transposable element-derived protein domain-containing protein n=1 Tax=Odynerus spinipes TaxID=1348599 RepID=A0AAD9RD55_9HYME|nr:hypothetical protein KPH14_012252 [Odynerus spinipes]
MRERNCSDTDNIEVEALLGLLLFAGVRRNNRLNAKDLFRTNGSSPEIFRLTMSWNRFYLLMRCLRFDEKDTRAERTAVDKLAPIRELLKKSCIPLLDKLESEYKLTVIGTIRKNKKELPKKFTEIRGRPEKSSLFGHRGNCSLVSYVPRKGKNVLLVSSMHDGAEINEVTCKPEMIMDYNITKGGVDTVDKMCETYNVARGTNRWPIAVFYNLMNVAGINTLVIYLQNNPNRKISRRIFLETLSYDLINSQLRRRTLNTSLPKTVKLRLAEICQLDGPEYSATSSNNKIGRCGYCSSKKKPKDTLQLCHLQQILLFGTCYYGMS